MPADDDLNSGAPPDDARPRQEAPTAHAGPQGTPAKKDHPSSRPSMRPGGAASLIGMTLSGRYRIERLLGEGGMGAVYQAEHLHMRKRFAVKVLHPEMSRVRDVVARFEREARAAAHIEHANVASATDFGKLEDGSFFLVLEFVEGKGLREAIAKGRLDIGRALHITRQIAMGLQRAHALNIVHRDLKPENVMLVERDGDSDFVKVLDFGIAKVPDLGEDEGDPAQPILTQAGMVYGTPEYMAPEQALGQSVDGRADLYGLGIIAFEMLAGTRPFNHKSKVALLGMQVTAKPPAFKDAAPDANIPPEVEALIVKLLAKEAAERVQDARELIESVNALLTQLAMQGVVDAKYATGAPLSGSMTALPPISLSTPEPSSSGSAGSVGNGLLTPTPIVQGEPPRRSRFVPVLAGVSGALIGIAIVVAVMTGKMQATPRADAGSIATTAASAAPSGSNVDADPETETRAAIATVDRGDYASGIAKLTALESAHPDRIEIHRALERAYVATSATKPAMQEVAIIVKSDPRAATDEKLANDIRNAAIGNDAPDVAFKILESDMGSAGVDVIYDIAYGASGTNFPVARTRARSLLGKSSVRALASSSLAVTLDLRAATACDGVKKLLDRAVDYGDERTRDVLRTFVTTRGCGAGKGRDCYPCLRSEGALTKALDALEKRLKYR